MNKNAIGYGGNFNLNLSERKKKVGFQKIKDKEKRNPIYN